MASEELKTSPGDSESGHCGRDPAQRSRLCDDDRHSCRVAIRMSICSQRTLEDDIDLTLEANARLGGLLSRNSYLHYEKSPKRSQ